jgi:hypothetical protein
MYSLGFFWERFVDPWVIRFFSFFSNVCTDINIETAFFTNNAICINSEPPFEIRLFDLLQI